MHARTQIRNAATALLDGTTSAGNNVFESRVYPIGNSSLPAILIYTKQENIAEHSISYPRTQVRELELTIEIYLKVSENSDESADNLLLEIEQKLAEKHNLDGLVKDLFLSSTEIHFSDEGEKPVVMATLTYNVVYTVKETTANSIS